LVDARVGNPENEDVHKQELEHDPQETPTRRGDFPEDTRKDGGIGEDEGGLDLPEMEAAVKASQPCDCQRKVQRPTVGLGHVMHVQTYANVGEPSGDEQAYKKCSKVSGLVRFPYGECV